MGWISLGISVFALVVATWIFYETRQTLKVVRKAKKLAEETGVTWPSEDTALSRFCSRRQGDSESTE